MKLLGKSAGYHLWEIWGPINGRNRWSDGIAGIAVTPSVDVILNAAAGTKVELYENTTALVLTGFNYGPITKQAHDNTPGITVTASSPQPASFAEGQRPDPSAWGAPVLTVTSAGALISGTYAPTIGDVTSPVWLRLVLAVPVPGPEEGYVKLATKWS